MHNPIFMQKKILYKAAGFAILAALANALMAALIKIEVMKGLAPPILIFWRSFWGLLFIIPQMALSSPQENFMEKIKTKHFGLLFVRALTGFLSFYFFFFSLKKLPLADATLLFFTFPLFMPLVGWLWKKIPFQKLEWIGLITGFAGIILIVRPGHELWQAAALIGLLAGIIYTVGQFAVHVLTLTDFYKSINFYYFAFLCLFSLPLTFLEGSDWKKLTAVDYWIFFGIGIFGFAYLVLLTHAMKIGSPNSITSCLYITVIYAMVLDWLIWSYYPPWMSVLGALLIFLGVTLKLYLHKHES